MNPPFSFLHKLATCLVAGCTSAAFWLLLGNGGGVPWLPALVVFGLVGLSLVGALVMLGWWQLRAKQGVAAKQLNTVLLLSIRYLTAFNLASFGWKKVLGLQFVVPAAIASQPLNQQSGEWLTWYYFGYSPAFGAIIAGLQIVGAGLLLFRRTLLLGTVLLAAVLFNLTLINIFYHLNAGALVQSVVASLALLFLLALHYRQLVAALLPLGQPSPVVARQVASFVGPLAVLLLAFLFTLYLKTMF